MARWIRLAITSAAAGGLALFIGSRAAPPAREESRAAARAAPEPINLERLPHPLGPVEPGFDEPPRSGPARRQWLRMMLGHTYAAITLLQDQLAFLESLREPNDVQRRTREQALEHLAELEQWARQQQAEIEVFDVNASAEANARALEAAAPVKLWDALGLRYEQWNALAVRHLGRDVTLSQRAFHALQRQQAVLKRTLGALEIPPERSAQARQEFLLVVDALIRAEGMRDRGAAHTLLVTRRKEFIERIRTLSVDRTQRGSQPG